MPPKLSVLASMAHLFNMYACGTQAEALQQRYDGKTVFEGANLVSIASVLTRVNNPFVQTSPLLSSHPYTFTLFHALPSLIAILTGYALQVFSAPTSAGKSLIAEILILRTLLFWVICM